MAIIQILFCTVLINYQTFWQFIPRKEAPPQRDTFEKQAGAPGFEPRSTAPKAGVLPLHHAPVRGTLYHSGWGWATPVPCAGTVCHFFLFQRTGRFDRRRFSGGQPQFAGFVETDHIRVGGNIAGFFQGIIPKSIDVFDLGLLIRRGE